jgi:peptide/nickel transport system substrate-binding protein
MRYPRLYTKLWVVSIAAAALLLVYTVMPLHSQASSGLPPMTPYNTLYSAVVVSTPMTSNSSYNPNIFTTSGIWTHQYGLNYAYLAMYNLSSGTWIPDLAYNWTIQYNLTVGNMSGWAKITVYLRHSGWSNGQPFTCWDLYATNLIQALIYDALGNVTWVNNYTCIIWVPPDAVVNSNNLMTFYYVSDGGLGIFINYQLYEPFIENLSKNWNILYAANFGYGTPQEQSEGASYIKTEFAFLHKYEPTFTFPPPQNGPFYVCDITPSEIILCKNPYYWDANNIKIDYVVLYQFTSTTPLFAALETGKLSFYQGNLPPSIASVVLKNPYMNYALTPGAPGDTLYINFLWPYMIYPQVRQALIYALNLTQVAEAAGAPYEPVPEPNNAIVYPTINPHSFVEMVQYWDQMGYPLINYTYNPTEAAQLLESVGFTKRNGIWYTPNGTPFKLVILVDSGSASNPQLMAMLTTVENQWNAFGIPTTITIEPSTEFPQIYSTMATQYALAYRYGPPGFSIIIPDLFPVNGYFEGYPINVTHWWGEVTLPNGTIAWLWGPNSQTHGICPPQQVTVQQIKDCVFMWAWEANHNPWFISLDMPYEEVWYNTKYLQFPPSNSWVWAESPSLEIAGPMWWSILTTVQPKPVVTTTTTTAPVVTTVSTTTTVTSTTTVVTSTTVVSGTTTTYTTTSTVPVTSTVTVTATAPPTTVTVTKPVISTALVIGIVVIVVVIAAVAAVIALRRR